MGLVETSSNKAYATHCVTRVCCSQSPCPHSRPLLTHASTGDTQIQFWQFEKSGEYQKNIYFCFIDYTKAFNCVHHNQLWKILQEMGIPEHLTWFLRSQYTGQEATLEPDVKQWTGSELGKEYIKAVFCYPAYLTYMQRIGYRVQ